MDSTTTNLSFVESLAQSLAALIRYLLELSLGSYAAPFAKPLYHDISIIDLLASLILLVFVVLASGVIQHVLWRRVRQAEEHQAAQEWSALILEALRKPLYGFIWILGVYVACVPLLLNLQADQAVHPLHVFVGGAVNWGAFFTLIWLFYRLIHVVETRLSLWARRTDSIADDLVVPLLGRSLKMAVPVIAVLFALPLLNLPEDYKGIVTKASGLLVIGTISWILCQAVLSTEQALLRRFDVSEKDNLRARKVHTQVLVLKKTLLFVIGIFTVASVLMTFEEVRRFGTSILASAGVVGIIVGFAAQRTISNLFAGFQLAMTQPIRLDDVVIVENEWGRIEEITLTYVVVRIWDMRRLIVPINYFIEQPFQNWTRVSADILGAVTLNVDYSVPFQEIREALKGIVEGCKDWDKKFWNMQVTDATERTVLIRVLATAADASAAWNLRCEIREKLIAHIQEHYPNSLPKLRSVLDAPAAPKTALPAMPVV